MNRNKVLYTLAALLTLVLIVRFVARFGAQFGDGAQGAGRPAGAALEERWNVAGSTRALAEVEPLDEGTPRPATLEVRVETVSVKGPMDWTLRVYREATRLSDRVLVETRRGSGDADVSFAVPEGTIGLAVDAPAAFGDGWREFDFESATRCDTVVTLHAASTLRGRVTNGHGAAIADARVLIVRSTDPPRSVRSPFAPPIVPGLQNPDLSSTSDETGAYVIEGIDPRVVHQVAAAARHSRVQRAYGLTVDPGGEVTHDFVLTSGARIVGRLVSPAGRPLPGAELALATTRSRVADGVVWTREAVAKTDREGRFELDGLTSEHKRLSTFVLQEDGATAIGRWDVDLVDSESRDLGDLVVGKGEFVARLTWADGPVDGLMPTVVVIPEVASGTGAVPAILSVPVVLGDDGLLRLRGAPIGTVRCTVAAGPDRTDGRHRPRSEFEAAHDGHATHVTWELERLVDGPSLRSASDPATSTLGLSITDRGPGDLYAVLVDGELVAMGPARGARASIAAPRGAAVRFVATGGTDYFEDTLRLEEDAQLDGVGAADRPGRTLRIKVEHEGRGVPGQMILAGVAGTARGRWILGETDRNGVLTCAGLPPWLDFVVSTVWRSQSTPARTIDWRGQVTDVRMEMVVD